MKKEAKKDNEMMTKTVINRRLRYRALPWTLLAGAVALGAFLPNLASAAGIVSNPTQTERNR